MRGSHSNATRLHKITNKKKRSRHTLIKCPNSCFMRICAAQQKKMKQKIARARTLTVLRGLDSSRKASVIQFLHEAGLIDKDRCIINLKGADLRGADLSNADLSSATLDNANLSGANFER